MRAATTFERYADVYDLFYLEKEYDAECDFLERVFERWSIRPVRRVLDLGCGTGGHAIPLAKRGYDVLGVDRSPEMLAVAERKASAAGVSDQAQFSEADARELLLAESFDAVICMFAVLSYQTTDEDVRALLSSARLALSPGGVFVADCWFGPAVHEQQPQTCARTWDRNGIRTLRTAIPAWNPANNTVQVQYRVLQFDDMSLVDEIRETHLLRYFFLPELREQLTDAGFELVHVCAFPTIDEPASEKSWNVALVARAVAD